MRFWVCDKCLAGFREDARPVFVKIGCISADACDNTHIACGGTFTERSAEDAIGPGGALDHALSRPGQPT